jgi:hypothetical protein
MPPQETGTVSPAGMLPVDWQLGIDKSMEESKNPFLDLPSDVSSPIP